MKQKSIIFFILLIICIYIATIYVIKNTISNYSNNIEREKNIKKLRGLIWSSYILTTFITIYLLIQQYSKIGFYHNKTLFSITILILLLNTYLTSHEECILINQLITNSKKKLEDMYTILTIMVVINVVSLLVLIYRGEGTKIYNPKYEYLHYELRETNGKIIPNALKNKPIIKPTKNITYKNVFQNNYKKIGKSILEKIQNVPNLQKLKKVSKTYINPILLEPKKLLRLETYINPILYKRN
jgi:hypothetical protein